MQIPIQIEVEGNNILGVIHVPQSCSTKMPVIMVCYGLNGNRVDNNRIAVMLGREAEKRGVMLVRFDYRGLGISEDTFSEIDMSTKIKDALVMHDFIGGCMQDTEFNLYLLGFSDGCRIATSLLNKNINTSGLILWSPIFYIEKKYVEDKMKKKFIRDPKSNKVVFPFKGLCVNPKHLRQQGAHEGEFETVRDYKKPKLAIFGGGDVATVAIYKSLREKTEDMGKFEDRFIPKADHLYSKDEWATSVITETLDWVTAKLSSNE